MNVASTYDVIITYCSSNCSYRYCFFHSSYLSVGFITLHDHGQGFDGESYSTGDFAD